VQRTTAYIICMILQPREWWLQTFIAVKTSSLTFCITSVNLCHLLVTHLWQP
jgi:hypothetical protein